MNYGLFQLINGFAGQSSVLDYIMVAITDSVPYITIAIFLLLWFRGKNDLLLYRRHTAIYAFCSTILALIVNVILHLVYYHPRPFVAHHVHKLIPHAPDSSFVSDHGILVFSLFWMMLLRKASWRYLVLAWALVVAISRIYVGVHYPLDVIGSAALALGTSSFILAISQKLNPFTRLIFGLYSRLAKRIPFAARSEKEKEEHF